MKAVKVRDLVLGDGIPKICVPVIAHTYQELVRSLDRIRKSPFDLVEFRADFYFEEEAGALETLREAVGSCPILYTIRTEEEGGEIEISDDEYRQRNLAAASMADLVDLQLGRLHAEGGNRQLHSDLVDRIHEAGAKVVLSWHDFGGTPGAGQIVKKLVLMQEEGCDISKAAVMPNSRKDVCALMEASAVMLEGKADRPFITLAMGEVGTVTRMACAFTGSCISFGTAGSSSAPGQIPAGKLRRIFDVTAPWYAAAKQ